MRRAVVVGQGEDRSWDVLTVTLLVCGCARASFAPQPGKVMGERVRFTEIASEQFRLAPSDVGLAEPFHSLLRAS